MINLITSGLELLAKGGAFFQSYKSVENFANCAAEQIDLEVQMHQYNAGARVADPSTQLEQNRTALQCHALQVALFSYTAYRLYSGEEESATDLAIGGSAALLTLYPKVKQGARAVMESDMAQSLSSKVFRSVSN